MRPIKSIPKRAKELGVKYINPDIKKSPLCWPEEDLKYLKENYTTMTDSQIAEHLGRTRPSVKNMRTRLCLEKR